MPPKPLQSLDSWKPLRDERAIFVTGTDTEVGKTVVSAAIARAWCAFGCAVCAVKPIASDCTIRRGRWVCDDAKKLDTACGDGADAVWHACGETPGEALLSFKAPLGPVSAARAEGRRLPLGAVERRVQRLARACEKNDARFLVEGIGGPLVPLSNSGTVADWIARLGLPVVLATRTRLGTISHTLMAVECLKARGIRIAGIVASRQEGGPLAEVEISSLTEIRTHTRGIPLAVLDFQSSED